MKKDIGPGPVGVDTVAFIYFIEEHPTFRRIIEPMFAGIDDGLFEAATSALTLLETLVIPYRAGNRALGDRYEAILTRSRGLRLIPLDNAVLRGAAMLRAQFRVKTPDALQLAASLVAGCKTFVTNDRDLPAIPGLRILQLNQYVKAP